VSHIQKIGDAGDATGDVVYAKVPYNRLSITTDTSPSEDATSDTEMPHLTSFLSRRCGISSIPTFLDM
jgi:hypothetical protein